MRHDNKIQKACSDFLRNYSDGIRTVVFALCRFRNERWRRNKSKKDHSSARYVRWSGKADGCPDVWRRSVHSRHRKNSRKPQGGGRQSNFFCCRQQNRRSRGNNKENNRIRLRNRQSHLRTCRAYQNRQRKRFTRACKKWWGDFWYRRNKAKRRKTSVRLL